MIGICTEWKKYGSLKKSFFTDSPTLRERGNQLSEPVLVGLLFADRVIVENNGKRGIIGTFNVFHSQNFPAVFPPWYLYAAVTNLTGKHTFALTLVNEETQQVLIPFNGEFESPETDVVVELTPAMMNVAFPRAGSYLLNFSVDGELLGTRILYVRQGIPAPAR